MKKSIIENRNRNIRKRNTGRILALSMGLMLALTACSSQTAQTGEEGSSAAAQTEESSAAAQAETEESSAAVQTEAEADGLAALDKAKQYIDKLTIYNSINDPEKVVSTWGRYFTWDNEKREEKKPYLYEWSYYNSVVFEGLDYIYDVTGDTAYSDYVTEYLEGMIAADGSWVQLDKGQAAGYNKEHGLDCFKTASLLLDYYDITGDSRYLTKAEELYQDLKDAESSYAAEAIGGNYYHTWANAPEYAVWLDGIYMAQPFMAEYAARYDKAELEQIAARFAWVGENMYDAENGLYYHAAGADANSGSYWLRSVGWYIAAMVDVMEYMEGENLAAMQAQLQKLTEGMLPYQDAKTGMWTNYITGTADNENNRLETSGTSLMVYGIMKAVNNGWLDASYADTAIQAFEGMCREKIQGSNLTDICFKGAPGSDNAVFYDNEGKGSGPFIMAYAEMLKYAAVSGQ